MNRCDVLFTESSRNVGGQEFQLLQQMRQLEARGHAVALACRPGSAILQRAEAAGLRVVPLPLRNALDLASLRGLRRLFVDERPRAVVCHSGHDANLVALAARLVRHRPRIIRSKTYVAGHPSAWNHSRLVDATMVPSEYLRRELLANPAIDAARVHVVHPGVDFAALDREVDAPLPPALADWLARGRGPVVAQVGMLRGEKGHAVALEALAHLDPAHAAVRYVAAGAGDHHDALLAQARALGLAERVWVGEVRPVAPLLARADLVVMPSTYEPLGMAQIEALGLGTPVLASRTGGIPETVTDGVTGVLVPPGDVQAWATALAAALAQPAAMRALAARGRTDVRARFAVERNTKALERLALG